jgi:hypothetical protein
MIPIPSCRRNLRWQAMWYLRPTTGMSASLLKETTLTSNCFTSTTRRHFHSLPGFPPPLAVFDERTRLSHLRHVHQRHRPVAPYNGALCKGKGLEGGVFEFIR